MGIGVRLRANDIDYTQTVLPESGQEDASIRSKALCLIFALNQGVRLTRRHWNTAVGCAWSPPCLLGRFQGDPDPS